MLGKTYISLSSILSVILISADKQLHVGGKNITEDHKFKSHNIYNAIKNTPECIAVRGSILAIGCKGGTHVFHPVIFLFTYICYDFSIHIHLL